MGQGETSTVDVVVIGSGFAGLAAAIEAAQAGASVLVIEKNRSTGGNSRISDGGIAAPGTDVQARYGYQDSAERMYEDMMRAGLGINHPALVRTVVEGARDAFYWTRDELGVPYLDRIDIFGGHSVHRCYTAENISGSTILTQQLARLDRLGVEVQTGVRFESFLVDADGRVSGVRCRIGHTHGERCLFASCGVVLATGGYGADVAFRSSQDPRLDGALDSTNRSSATAEGIKACLRLGAMPVQLSHIQLGPWGSPDEAGYGHGPMFSEYVVFQYGIIVDPSDGRRFADELADRKTLSDRMLERKHPCIGIADEKAIVHSGWDVTKALKNGVVRAFDDWQALADAYDIPFAALTETVEGFNESVRAGVDEAFFKTILPDASPLGHAPYYAIRLWPKVHHVSGGIAIDPSARVLDLEGRQIPGLFAAGEAAGGIHGACRLGSCAITECLVFGRIAGRNSAGACASDSV